jgi:UDP-N-acetylmuramoyl-tripeptide--D-alanyl-D-alanine ligase
MLTLADILEALTGQRMAGEKQAITMAAIDSREAKPGALFIAFPGEQHDGHDFVGDAFGRGAILALVQREVGEGLRYVDLRDGSQHDEDAYSELPLCMLVEDPLAALQEIARQWRKRFDLRVIGITGSVGKTTTKEVAAEVLDGHYKTLKNPGNLNNEIGLPLTLLGLDESHERAVLEMGFYVPGEIRLLCDIALPQVGLVTNIGTVHAERAGSQEAIVRGKTELVQALPKDGTAILNYDDELVRNMAQQTEAAVLYYGLTPEADLWADEIEGLGLDGVRFRLHHRDEDFHLRIPMIGRHSVQTALRAAAVGFVEGLDWSEIIARLRSAQAELRLVTVRTSNGALLLDDTYNATPESTLAAINLLAELEGRRIAVLGDMLELGPYEQQGHEKVGIRAAQVADQLVTVGPRARMIAKAAREAGLDGKAIAEFESTGEAIEYMRERLSPTDVVLVKGSRGMQMDIIAPSLEKVVE